MTQEWIEVVSLGFCFSLNPDYYVCGEMYVYKTYYVSLFIVIVVELGSQSVFQASLKLIAILLP